MSTYTVTVEDPDGRVSRFRYDDIDRAVTFAQTLNRSGSVAVVDEEGEKS